MNKKMMLLIFCLYLAVSAAVFGAGSLLVNWKNSEDFKAIFKTRHNPADTPEKFAETAKTVDLKIKILREEFRSASQDVVITRAEQEFFLKIRPFSDKRIRKSIDEKLANINPRLKTEEKTWTEKRAKLQRALHLAFVYGYQTD